jgi:hypothetical protein
MCETMGPPGLEHPCSWPLSRFRARTCARTIRTSVRDNPTVAADLDRVLRLKATIIAAARVGPDDAAAEALTESYNRFYQVARQLVEETNDLPTDEFDQLFEPLDGKSH